MVAAHDPQPQEEKQEKQSFAQQRLAIQISKGKFRRETINRSQSGNSSPRQLSKFSRTKRLGAQQVLADLCMTKRSFLTLNPD